MEAIELKVKKDYFPVKLIDEESEEVVDILRFYYDDNTVKTFQKDAEAVQERINKIDLSGKAQSEAEDEVLKEFFDYVLGEGSYEKIKLAQRSIVHRKEMLIDLSLALSNALYTLAEQQEEKQAEFYAVD